MRLTPTSYITLGLIRWAPGSTAYDLERTINVTVSRMWIVQRSQIYREPGRLAAGGLLEATSDADGSRPRTRFTITAEGEAAFERWLEEGAVEAPQLRDLAILKVFFGATPATLARVRVLAHEAQLKEFELLRAAGGLTHEGPRLALDAAIAHERTSITYWKGLLDER